MLRKMVDDPTAAVLVQLIERIADRDAAALRALYELTSTTLFAVALRILRRREFAEEALQDAFLNIWKFASDYDVSMSPPLVWMRLIVRSRTLDYMRRRRSLSGLEIEWTDMLEGTLAIDNPDPFDLAVLDQRAWHLTICMSLLEANQRRALELAYFSDLTHREVAEEMNAPLGTVKAWIRRATEALKVSLTILEATAPLTGCPRAESSFIRTRHAPLARTQNS
jgi:RNA polymerase sigma-70 factor (ECF subfamily)